MSDFQNLELFLRNYKFQCRIQFLLIKSAQQIKWYYGKDKLKTGRISFAQETQKENFSPCFLSEMKKKYIRRYGDAGFNASNILSHFKRKRKQNQDPNIRDSRPSLGE